MGVAMEVSSVAGLFVRPGFLAEAEAAASIRSFSCQGTMVGGWQILISLFCFSNLVGDGAVGGMTGLTRD